MYQIRSIATGDILGVAATLTDAQVMAMENGWRNWTAEILPTDLELAPERTDTDPYNMRGRKVLA